VDQKATLLGALFLIVSSILTMSDSIFYFSIFFKEYYVLQFLFWRSSLKVETEKTESAKISILKFKFVEFK
jgi:hypothetical protein